MRSELERKRLVDMRRPAGWKLWRGSNVLVVDAPIVDARPPQGAPAAGADLPGAVGDRMKVGLHIQAPEMALCHIQVF